MVRIDILVQEAHIIVYRVYFVSARKQKLRIIMNNSLSCFGKVFTSRYSFTEEWDHFCIVKFEGNFNVEPCVKRSWCKAFQSDEDEGYGLCNEIPQCGNYDYEVLYPESEIEYKERIAK